MWPVIAAVATTVAAFIPMLLISGTSGEFMAILPKTVIVCLLASLFEALVILPAHYVDFGSRRRAADALAETPPARARVAGATGARRGSTAGSPPPGPSISRRKAACSSIAGHSSRSASAALFFASV